MAGYLTGQVGHPGGTYTSVKDRERETYYFELHKFSAHVKESSTLFGRSLAPASRSVLHTSKCPNHPAKNKAVDPSCVVMQIQSLA